MKVNVTDLVFEFLKSKGLKAKKIEDTQILLRFDITGGTTDVILDFAEDGSHVHLEGLNFMKVPEEKYSALYPVVNQLNDQYKNVKFVLLEKHGQIVARDDGVIDLETCGEETLELMIIMVKIIDDAYPKLMKAIWA